VSKISGQAPSARARRRSPRHHSSRRLRLLPRRSSPPPLRPRRRPRPYRRRARALRGKTTMATTEVRAWRTECHHTKRFARTVSLGRGSVRRPRARCGDRAGLPSLSGHYLRGDARDALGSTPHRRRPRRAPLPGSSATRQARVIGTRATSSGRGDGIGFGIMSPRRGTTRV